MSRNLGLLAVFVSSLLLSACYMPAGYSYSGYNRGYGTTGAPPGYSGGTGPGANVAAAPPAPPIPLSPAVPMPRPLANVQPGPAVAPVATTSPTNAPAAAAAGDATALIEPTSGAPSFSGPIALPALVLPVRQNWSSAKCPRLAVTFTGSAQPHEISLADTASFEEARQFRDGDYAEMAECFCPKSGNLSDISKVAANTAMSQMARQFTDQLYMQTRNISFVETSPLGAYSQLDASSENPATLKASLRVYWRGQCSIRLAVVSTPATQQRAAEFLNSLREIKGDVFPDSETPLAVPVVPVISAALPPPGKAGKTPIPSTSLDLEQEMKQKTGDMVAEAPMPMPMPEPVQVAAAAPDPSANQNAASRLRQLQELKHKGLINETEYDAKRQAILNGL